MNKEIYIIQLWYDSNTKILSWFWDEKEAEKFCQDYIFDNGGKWKRKFNKFVNKSMWNTLQELSIHKIRSCSYYD